MSSRSRANCTRYTAKWPIQGLASFRSSRSELIVSDVYWRWIYEALSGRGGREKLEFVAAVEDGFSDASCLVETIPVSEAFLKLLREVSPSAAPSFDLIVPDEGDSVPSPEEILTELVGVVGDALREGSMEMEIE